MDDSLRGAERSSRADPTDVEARRGLVRRLERAGDARGAWLERTLLSDSGDVEARRGLGRPPGARGPVRGRTCTFPRRLAPLAGSSEVLALVGDGALVALDPVDLRELWSTPLAKDGAAVRSGPDVLHSVPGDPRALALRDGRTGEVVAMLNLPDRLARPDEATDKEALEASYRKAARVGGGPGIAWLGAPILAADGDRLLACGAPPSGSPPGSATVWTIDVGQRPGEVLHARVKAPGVELQRVWSGRRIGLWHGYGAAFASEMFFSDGPGTRWRSQPGCHVVSSDDGTALLSRNRGDRRDLSELDLATGEESFAFAAPFRSLTSLWRRGVWIQVQREGISRIERGLGLGKPRWRFETVGDEDVLGNDVALAEDVIYALRAPAGPAIVGIDPESGRGLWSVAIDVDLAGESPTLVAVDHGVVLVAHDDERTRCVRIGDA